MKKRNGHQQVKNYQNEGDPKASQTSRDFYTVRLWPQRQDFHFRLRLLCVD